VARVRRLERVGAWARSASRTWAHTGQSAARVREAGWARLEAARWARDGRGLAAARSGSWQQMASRGRSSLASWAQALQGRDPRVAGVGAGPGRSAQGRERAPGREERESRVGEKRERAEWERREQWRRLLGHQGAAG
jgi:hypothetical protein